MQVEAFMLRGGQQVPLVPTEPSKEIRELRAKLILEEAIETVGALGFHIQVPNPQLSLLIDDVEFTELKRGFDLTEVIDGCCDISVVTIGTLSACGVPDLPFLSLVDKNNLLKFGPGSSIREDGKIMKPPGHKPPDIKGLLESLLPPVTVPTSVTGGQL